MKKYVLTSPKFEGSVTFGYHQDGHLMLYSVNTDSLPVIMWLKNHLPVNQMQLDPIKQRIEGTIQEVPEDLSFNAFWERYGRKINRKRCEPIWKKMSEAERLLAITRIGPYEKYLERTGYRGKADPENYLKKGTYETDWIKER